MTAKGPWDRRFAFTAPFMVRMSMAFLRAIGKGGGTQDSFIHVILQVNYMQLFTTLKKLLRHGVFLVELKWHIMMHF